MRDDFMVLNKQEKKVTEITFLKFKSGKTWRIDASYDVTPSVCQGERHRKDNSLEQFIVPLDSIEYIVSTNIIENVDGNNGKNGTGENSVNDDIGDSVE